MGSVPMRPGGVALDAATQSDTSEIWTHGRLPTMDIEALPVGHRRLSG
jgi:hypothetical protein